MGYLPMTKNRLWNIKILNKLTGPVRANIQPSDGIIYYRVLVLIEDGHHIVHVGNDMTRRFTYDTLPSTLKHKLAILKARGEFSNNNDVHKSSLGLFLSPEDGGGIDIVGWRTGENMYIVVLSKEELDRIKTSI